MAPAIPMLRDPRGIYRLAALNTNQFTATERELSRSSFIYNALQDAFSQVAALSRLTLAYYFEPSPFANQPLHRQFNSLTHHSVGVGFGRTHDGQLEIAIRHSIHPHAPQLPHNPRQGIYHDEDVVTVSTEDMITNRENALPKLVSLIYNGNCCPFPKPSYPSRIALSINGFTLLGKNHLSQRIQQVNGNNQLVASFENLDEFYYPACAASSHFRYDRCSQSILIPGRYNLFSYPIARQPHHLYEPVGMAQAFGVAEDAIVALTLTEQVVRIDGCWPKPDTQSKPRVQVADRKPAPNPKITDLESYYQHRKTVCAISTDHTQLFLSDRGSSAVTVLDTTDLTQKAVWSWDAASQPLDNLPHRLVEVSRNHLVIVDWHDNAQPKTFWKPVVAPTAISATCYFLSLEHGHRVCTLQFKADKPVLDSVALGERLFVVVLYNPKTMTFSHEYFDFGTPQNRAVVNGHPSAAAGAGAQPPQTSPTGCSLQ